MYEIKVTWSEETRTPSIYQFKELKEAKAFQQGLVETRDKIPECPQIYKIEKGRWGELPSQKSPWLPLIFSLFVGLWTGLWWNFLNWDVVVPIAEHILMGSVTTLGCYVSLLLYNRVKK